MPIHDWTKVRSGTFHNFHVLWTAKTIDALNGGILPPGYFAMAEQNSNFEEDDFIITDASPKTRFVMPIEVERYAEKANRIAVHHELGDVVAIIEIVSPGNKDSSHAIRAFREKAAELIRQGVNLLVVDLFPPGPRDPQGIHKAIWDELTDEPFELPVGKPLTLAAYQASPIKTAYVEPVAVGDTLPDMPLYLEADYYVNVPLEATYQATWNVLPKEIRALVA